jgi:hypothetical protein
LHCTNKWIQIIWHICAIWSVSILIFDSLGYFWPKSEQCRTWSDGMYVLAYLNIHSTCIKALIYGLEMIKFSVCSEQHPKDHWMDCLKLKNSQVHYII